VSEGEPGGARADVPGDAPGGARADVPGDAPGGARADVPGGAPGGARIVLYTRAGCHLCDDARAALARVQLKTGVGVVEVDIAGDPDLTAEYGDRIPVVVLDGREHGYWRVEEARLLRDLAR
jgi:hypothetical protein